MSSITRDMVRSFLPKFSSKAERRLLALCKNNPDDDSNIKKWNKNAVQYLVKKLKKNIDVIDELEKAISQECSNTKCVPVSNTPDNRLLVAHRRGLPQVIYCRLWRWPDLQSHHQIKAIPTCDTNIETAQGTDRSSRSQTVCVNPYHYERKKPAPLEPVLVPCSRIPPDLSTSFEDSDPSCGTRAIPGRFGLHTSLASTTVRNLLTLGQPSSLPGPNPQLNPIVQDSAPQSSNSTLSPATQQTPADITMSNQQPPPQQQTQSPSQTQSAQPQPQTASQAGDVDANLTQQSKYQRLYDSH